MVEKEIVVQNSTGIHAFYAAKITAITSQYESDLFIKKGKKAANCTNMISLLSLQIKKGDSIIVLTDGIDEREALEALINYIKGLSD